MTRRALPLLAGTAALLLMLIKLSGSLWSDSVDVAHHYALVARLAELWTLPTVDDPSLGEMNVYPRLAHGFAAALAHLGGSPLLGMQWTAAAAWLAAWGALIAMLRQLPARAALLASALLAALLLLNRYWLKLELHGGELVVNFFFSQIAAQAVALLALLAVLRLERAGVAPLWRYALLLAAIRLVCGIHLIPALELLAVLTLKVALELPSASQRRPAHWTVLLAPLVGALLVYTHPAYAVMKSISRVNGGMPTAWLDSLPAFGAYALALLLLSAALLAAWRRLGAHGQAEQALSLKYLGLYGMAAATACLLQLAALYGGHGSEYAIKKYVFSLHSAMLLGVCLLPVVLSGWHRGDTRPGVEQRWHQAGWLAALGLLALATLGMLPAQPGRDIAAMVRIENRLGLLHDLRLTALKERYTYVSQLPGLSPNNAYMFSIGIFRTPRTPDLLYVMNGHAPQDLRVIGHLLTGPAGQYSQHSACREAGSTATLLILDGACLQQREPAGGSPSHSN